MARTARDEPTEIDGPPRSIYCYTRNAFEILHCLSGSKARQENLRTWFAQTATL
jgi:hypothetical protein